MLHTQKRNIKQLHEKISGLYSDAFDFGDDGKKQAEFWCCPTEQIDERHNFATLYNEHFDAVLFSPPYFELEEYVGGEQSIESFGNYEEWLEGYWRPTVELCYKTLRSGGRMGLIISDYKNAQGKMVPISEDMLRIATEYFNELPHQRIVLSSFKTLQIEKQKAGNAEHLWLLEKA